MIYIEIGQALYLSFVVLFSSFIQGITGFGFALVAVPLLNIFFPLATVVPIVTICSAVINIIVLVSEKRFINLKQIRVLILFGIIGIPFGVYALKNIDLNVMKLFVGIILILTSIAMLKGAKVKFKSKTLSQCIAGLISGVLNGAISMSGPPIVLFLTNEGNEKNSFKSNMALYSLVTNVMTILAYLFEGMINRHIINVSGFSIVAILIGTSTGIVISRKIKESAFKKIVLILLIVMGLMTVVKTVI